MHNQFPCAKNSGSFRRTTRSAKKNRFSRGKAHAKILTNVKRVCVKDYRLMNNLSSSSVYFRIGMPAWQPKSVRSLSPLTMKSTGTLSAIDKR